MFRDNRQFPRLLLLLLVLLSACEEGPRLAKNLVVEVTPVDRLEMPAWNMVSADFDQDGDLDVFVHGHRGAEGDLIYYREGESFVRHGPVLKREVDRHACAAGDVNGDLLPDLYCTSGADKGAGVNPNELWINRDGLSFDLAETPFGAEEGTSRGRLAAFLRLNNDEHPDLVTTVWGPRDDDEPNESRLFLNKGVLHEREQFSALNTRFGQRWGGRCLAAYDFNGDDFDDLFACAEGPGAGFFINDKGLNFVAGETLDPKFWWWGATAGRGGLDKSPILAVVGHRSKRSFILIKAIEPEAENAIQRFACSFDQPGEADSIFCGDLLLADMNDDGHADLYISRRKGWMLDPPKGDMEDLIVFGPHFKQYLAVPQTSFGAGWKASPADGGVFRLNAGEKWAGSLDFVRLVDKSP